MSATPDFHRPAFGAALRRLQGPRRFIQVLAGPRQVGKTTLARQLIAAADRPSHYASADDVAPGRPAARADRGCTRRSPVWSPPRHPTTVRRSARTSPSRAPTPPGDRDLAPHRNRPHDRSAANSPSCAARSCERSADGCRPRAPSVAKRTTAPANPEGPTSHASRPDRTSAIRRPIPPDRSATNSPSRPGRTYERSARRCRPAAPPVRSPTAATAPGNAKGGRVRRRDPLK